MRPVFLKLGGSLITDKARPFTARLETIRRLAGEIKEAVSSGPIPLLLGHGGGSFPHGPAKEYRTSEGIINGQSFMGIALVQDAAAQLNRIVLRELLAAGLPAVSISPSSSCVSKNGKIVEWYTKPVRQLLEKGMLPVVYGDVVPDTGKGCSIASTEMLFSFLAKGIAPSRIIMAGKTDGVFTADPGQDTSARPVPEITPKNFSSVRRFLAGSDATDVTGGMLHKVEEGLALAQQGIETWIVNGGTPGLVGKLLAGRPVPGTVIRE